MEKKKTIALFPAPQTDQGNPYQGLVEQALTMAGYNTIRIPNRKLFPFFQLLNPQIDAVHFFWPHDFYIGRNHWSTWLKKIMFMLSLPILKKVKIVYSAENLVSHQDNTNVNNEKKWIRRIINSSDAIVCMSNRSKSIFCDFYAIKDAEKVFVIPHASYDTVYPNHINKAEAKRRIGINDNYPTLVSLGRIDAYKGYKELIKTILPFKDVKGTLLIAGRCKDPELLDTLNKLVAENESNIKIIIVNKFIPDEELQVYFNAAEGAIINYLDVPLNPGSLIMSMGYGLNIIAPIAGAVPEIVPPEAFFGYEQGDSNSLGKQLKAFFSDKELESSGNLCRKKIQGEHNLSHVASRFAMLYKNILK